MNDMLIFGEYQITYTPTSPVENIDQAYLFRLFYGATLIGSYQPFPDIYYRGYRKGVFAFYYSAAQVVALQALIGVVPWDQTFTVKFEGNPTLVWSGPTPLFTRDITAGSSNWHTTINTLASHSLLETGVRTIAGHIQSSWGVALLSGTPSRLTSADGVPYFSAAVQNLQLMAPAVFPNLITSPTIITRQKPMTYAQTLENRWKGTALDPIMYQSLFGLSHMLWKSILWFSLMFLISIAIKSKLEGDTKAIWFLSFPTLFVGTFLGFVPMNFTALIAALGYMGIGFILFYNR